MASFNKTFINLGYVRTNFIVSLFCEYFRLGIVIGKKYWFFL